MSFDRLRYEIKLMWKALFLIPVTVLALIGSFAMLQHFLQQSIARTLLSEIEIFLPLAAGLVVGTTIAQDSALELQLTVPKSYHTTGMLRLGLISGWTGLLSLLCLAGITAFKVWELPPFALVWSPAIQFFTVQLIWFVPLLWFVAAGLFLALLTQSRTASGTLIGGLWLFDILFSSTLASTAWLRPALLFPTTLIIYPTAQVSQSDFNIYWLTTRFELLGMAVVLLCLGWLLLHDAERLLKGTTIE